MNVFHWHLTDDQGWRIEIKSLPRLTEVGAWRAERVGDWWSRSPQQPGEPLTYGGYYTQEDIKEVLAYARQRYVRVIPEIDVPGHSLAALVAYPELACFKAPQAINVSNKFYGIDENALCVGNEKTFEFLDKVFTEVAALFPDEYIHVGGDECFKGFWAKCPKCQQRKRTEHLKDEKELQSYFIHRLESMLKQKGKRLIGWNEILEGGLAPEGMVLGAQGNLWSEAVPTFRHAEYMTWPRGWALAEVLWSGPDKTDWDGFWPRVEKHLTIQTPTIVHRLIPNRCVSRRMLPVCVSLLIGMESPVARSSHLPSTSFASVPIPDFFYIQA